MALFIKVDVRQYMIHCFILLFLLFVITDLVSAQLVLTDDFSDGDFSHNPPWSGDTNLFIVNSNFELQLNAADGGNALLFVSYHAFESMEWRAKIRMAFSPSDNNFLEWDIYRFHSDIHSERFFLRVGENGSEDGIDLFFSSGDIPVRLIDGLPATVIQTNNVFSIKLVYIEGQWILYADTDGFGWFKKQGSVFYPTEFQSGVMQINCQFTSSNASRFYFDDFYLGPPIQDTLEPVLDRLIIEADGSLSMYFSEMMDTMSLIQTSFYVLDSHFYPIEIELNTQNANWCKLRFEEPLGYDTFYQLLVQGLSDTAGNMLADTLIALFHYNPKFFDVIINEIMADPNPAVDLPDKEYIELFNRSDFDINLSDYSLSINSKNYLFSDIVIESNAYLLITSTGACFTFGPGISCIDMLGSNAITNVGGYIRLHDRNGRVMSFTEYSDTWYGNDFKADGGWSLECIDADNFCGENRNWSASEHYLGGTPGRKNSIQSYNPDLIEFRLLRGYFEDSTCLRLVFNKSIDFEQLKPEVFRLNGFLPDSIVPRDLFFKELGIRYSAFADIHLLNKINLSGIWDICGLEMQARELSLGFPSYPEQNDLVINELLFNPASGGVDYVELYNRSSRIIDLKNLRIARFLDSGNELTQISSITTDTYLLFQGDYLVLTSKPELVRQHYHSHGPMAFMEKGVSIPSMNNESGSFVLLDQALNLIDQVRYLEDWHHGFLKDFKGVSLERLNPDWPSLQQDNWSSAAEYVGFGTPGLRNSQYQEEILSNKRFALLSESFSPNNDGNQDLLIVQYDFDKPGYILSASVFDVKGRLQRKILVDEHLPISGQIIWDGESDRAFILPMGIYIIHFEYFHPYGDKGQEQLSFALIH